MFVYRIQETLSIGTYRYLIFVPDDGDRLHGDQLCHCEVSHHAGWEPPQEGKMIAQDLDIGIRDRRRRRLLVGSLHLHKDRLRGGGCRDGRPLLILRIGRLTCMTDASF
jgi:hypothetical protein